MGVIRVWWKIVEDEGAEASFPSLLVILFLLHCLIILTGRLTPGNGLKVSHDLLAVGSLSQCFSKCVPRTTINREAARNANSAPTSASFKIT
jgi:hypothetical protein